MIFRRAALVAVLAATMLSPAALTAAETVATAVYARVAKDYKRVRLQDHSFKPEYYALANGGRIEGTSSDKTVDRVGYPTVAQTAVRLLAQQNYHYAQSKEQARLLIVLHWGNTFPSKNDPNYTQYINIMGGMQRSGNPQGMGSMDRAANLGGSGMPGGAWEDILVQILMEERVRDRLNARTARVLGYLDDVNDSNDIRRWAGGGDRYNDLISEVEDPRYYFVISAYDFPELLKSGQKKLLWQTRVSVRSAGNSFDDSFVPMLRSASRYFGRDSGKLVRKEEDKVRVELGDLKFLGEVEEVPKKNRERSQ